MPTNKEVANAFYSKKALEGKNIASIVCSEKEKAYLVGYGWALYGEIDIVSGKVTFHSGWDRYSNSTTKQISVSGIRSVADIVTDGMLEFKGC